MAGGRTGEDVAVKLVEPVQVRGGDVGRVAVGPACFGSEDEQAASVRERGRFWRYLVDLAAKGEHREPGSVLVSAARPVEQPLGCRADLRAGQERSRGQDR